MTLLLAPGRAPNADATEENSTRPPQRILRGVDPACCQNVCGLHRQATMIDARLTVECEISPCHSQFNSIPRTAKSLSSVVRLLPLWNDMKLRYVITHSISNPGFTSTLSNPRKRPNRGSRGILIVETQKIPPLNGRQGLGPLGRTND